MSDTVQLEIDVEPLRNRRLAIATPAYGGGIHVNYLRSVLELQKTLLTCGIEHEFYQIYNESLISRARNGIAQTFLDSECTDLLFIDADIEFSAVDVIALLHFDKQMIGGAYPLKRINWDAIKYAISLDPDIDPEALPILGCHYASHLLDGASTMEPFKPIECEELATGFMMVKRDVFAAIEPMCESYEPKYAGDGNTKNRSTHRDYFQVGVHAGRYESEDYSFCRMWRNTGGKIFLCPWMKLTHHGNYPFPGDMKAQADKLGVVY